MPLASIFFLAFSGKITVVITHRPAGHNTRAISRAPASESGQQCAPAPEWTARKEPSAKGRSPTSARTTAAPPKTNASMMRSRVLAHIAWL
jgi:hypothetical protein